ncbi:MAG: hypothetical protein LCH46_06345 [Proteobacteria bacterium]|nr:hypothetical protein [Pseudomonadota bacterium]
MGIIRKHGEARTLPMGARRVLYVGHGADEICHFLAQHLGRIDIAYESRASDAIAQLKRSQFDSVVIDLRSGGGALKLLLPLAADLGTETGLVVICESSDVSSSLAVPGVARVLAAPLREGQFLRALGLNEKPKHFRPPQDHGSVAEATSQIPGNLLKRLSGSGMKLMSLLYKRAAFVALAALFSAFVFYGLLIGFFLLSSGWGAPMTLARGHELVSKAERDLTELSVALSQTEQRLTQARAERVLAEREKADAEVLVTYAASTVGKEIDRIGREGKALEARIARLTRVKRELDSGIGKGGMGADLARLYDKRLISKKEFNASTLGLLEASQRLAGIESDLDALHVQGGNAEVTLAMLESLRDALASGKPISSVSGSTTELLLLTKQSVDAKAALDNASESLSSNAELQAELGKARDVLKGQIAALETSALGRAIHERIDVVFVPYANEARFRPGSSLWSCSWTLVWCSRAGDVGQVLPGEVASVHPFFGKPIRGFLVEARLADPSAASREIIHGARAPFFF